MLKVERIETTPALEALEQAWGDLNRASCEDGVFFSFEWFAAWWKAFGSKKSLYVLVLKSDNEIVGIAPLISVTVQRLGRTFKIIKFIGQHETEYHDFIGSDKKLLLDTVLEYLKCNPGDWTHLELASIKAENALAEALRTLPRVNRFMTSPSPGTDNLVPRHFVKPNRLDEELREARSAFGGRERLALSEITEPGEIENNLPVFFQLHINSARGNNPPSYFTDSAFRRFYTDLVRRLARRQMISLIRLSADDILVAYGLNFIRNGKALTLDLAANPLYRGRSPELLFTLMQSQHLIQGGRRVELSRNLLASVFAGGKRDTASFTIYRRKIDYYTGRIISWLAGTQPLKSMLQNPKSRVVAEKIRKILAKDGLQKLALKVLTKTLGEIGAFIYSQKQYYIYRHQGGEERPPRIKVNIEVRKLGLPDVDRIATFYGAVAGKNKYETIRNRFEKGGDCYAALHHGYIVAMVWGIYHEDYHREFNLRLTPGPDEVVICDALTSLIYRSMGIAPYLLALMLNDYHKSGHVAIAGILKTNMPSRKGLEIYNFKHVRTMRIIKILGVKFRIL